MLVAEADVLATCVRDGDVHDQTGSHRQVFAVKIPDAIGIV